MLFIYIASEHLIFPPQMFTYFVICLGATPVVQRSIIQGSSSENFLFQAQYLSIVFVLCLKCPENVTSLATLIKQEREQYLSLLCPSNIP